MTASATLSLGSVVLAQRERLVEATEFEHDLHVQCDQNERGRDQKYGYERRVVDLKSLGKFFVDFQLYFLFLLKRRND